MTIALRQGLRPTDWVYAVRTIQFLWSWSVDSPGSPGISMKVVAAAVPTVATTSVMTSPKIHDANSHLSRRG